MSHLYSSGGEETQEPFHDDCPVECKEGGAPPLE
ncbi:hypothetical protein AVEN_190666-1, partial [Araneus ventricosus]